MDLKKYGLKQVFTALIEYEEEIETMGNMAIYYKGLNEGKRVFVLEETDTEAFFPTQHEFYADETFDIPKSQQKKLSKHLDKHALENLKNIIKKNRVKIIANRGNQ